MHFVRQYKFALAFLLLLVFCSVMVVRQLEARKSHHVELLDAMILLQTGGYSNQADRIYIRLLKDLDKLPTWALTEDWRKTVTLIDPSSSQPSNTIWRYHWTVRNEMERRAESTIQRALKLAEEQD